MDLTHYDPSHQVQVHLCIHIFFSLVDVTHYNSSHQAQVHLCIHIFFSMRSTLWCNQHSWLQTVWIFFGRAQLVCQLLNATLKLPRFAPNFWVTHNCFLNTCILNVLRSSELLALSCIVADICKKILTFSISQDLQDLHPFTPPWTPMLRKIPSIVLQKSIFFQNAASIEPYPTS